MRVGTGVANTQGEGSFLIPGGRQRQTLSPLLNPAGQPGLFLSFNLFKTFLTAENAERAENDGKALDQVVGKDPVIFFYSL